MRGWQWIIVLQLAVAASYGIGAWGIVMTVAPLIAGDDLAGDFMELMVFVFIGILVACALEILLAITPWWSARLPLLADEGHFAGRAGAALGALAAVPAQHSLLAHVLAVGAFLLLTILTVHRARKAVQEQHEAVHEHARLMHLHAYGTSVRANVLEAIHIGGGPTFLVAVEYMTPSGRHEVTDHHVFTSPAGAPVVGGTMLLWFMADGSDTENIDIEEDPASIRDPEAAERYRDRD